MTTAAVARKYNAKVDFEVRHKFDFFRGERGDAESEAGVERNGGAECGANWD